jgi:hypothetical protein
MTHPEYSMRVWGPPKYVTVTDNCYVMRLQYGLLTWPSWSDTKFFASVAFGDMD